jgi:hypothetical protein
MQLVFAAATVVVRIATVVQFIQVVWERSTVCGVDRDGYSLLLSATFLGTRRSRYRHGLPCIH